MTLDELRGTTIGSKLKYAGRMGSTQVTADVELLAIIGRRGKVKVTSVTSQNPPANFTQGLEFEAGASELSK